MSAILRRLGWCVAIVISVVTASFLILHLAPGDPARTITGPHATEETLAHARALHGLDEPLPAQYLRYLSNLVQGDLGQSYRTQRPVTEILADHAWPTVQLVVAAVLLQVMLGLSMGLLAARFRRRWPDRVVSGFTTVAMATPPFVVGTVLLYTVGFRLDWLPINGYGEGFFDRLAHLVLPALTTTFGSAALTAQLTRSEVGRTLEEDFVRTARAKGVGERAVLWRHALRPSAAPMVSSIGSDIAAQLAAAVLAESIFGWPGIGRETLLAVIELDIPLVLGVVIITSVTIAISGLLIDLVTLALDPRTRDER